jgi:hypothetical protein
MSAGSIERRDLIPAKNFGMNGFLSRLNVSTEISAGWNTDAGLFF